MFDSTLMQLVFVFYIKFIIKKSDGFSKGESSKGEKHKIFLNLSSIFVLEKR